jgi:hypothetical protein
MLTGVNEGGPTDPRQVYQQLPHVLRQFSQPECERARQRPDPGSELQQL